MNTQSSCNSEFLVLRLKPVAQFQVYGATLCGGGLSSTVSEFALQALKISLINGSSLLFAAFAFTAAAYPIYERMERRAMEAGQWRIDAMRPPKINL